MPNNYMNSTLELPDVDRPLEDDEKATAKTVPIPTPM